MRLRLGFSGLLLLITGACAQEPAPAAPGPPSQAYSRDTPVEILAADPAAAAVLRKDMPDLLSDERYPMFKAMSLKQLQTASGGELSEQTVDKTVADLQALPPH